MGCVDRLCDVVVIVSCYHARDPGFDSRMYPGSVWSGTGSIQPHEVNWIATETKSREIRLRKLKLILRVNVMLTK